MALVVKDLPANTRDTVWSLGQEDPLEEGMATHSSILAWRILWTEELDRLQSMGSQRVGHDWAISLHFTSKILSMHALSDLLIGDGEMNVKSWAVEENDKCYQDRGALKNKIRAMSKTTFIITFFCETWKMTNCGLVYFLSLTKLQAGFSRL